MSLYIVIFVRRGCFLNYSYSLLVFNYLYLLYLILYLLQMEVILSYAIRHSLSVSIPNESKYYYGTPKIIDKKDKENKNRIDPIVKRYYDATDRHHNMIGTEEEHRPRRKEVAVVENPKQGVDHIDWAVALEKLDAKSTNALLLITSVDLEEEDWEVDLKKLDENANRDVDDNVGWDDAIELAANANLEKKRYSRCKCSDCQAWRLKKWT